MTDFPSYPFLVLIQTKNVHELTILIILNFLNVIDITTNIILCSK